MPSKQPKAAYRHSFQELRDWVLKKVGAFDHFEFRKLGSEYGEYWDEINRVEFERGYDDAEYSKPDSPALWQMKLLTTEELEEWKREFLSIQKNKLRKPRS